MRFIGKCSRKQRHDENEIDTKDPDRRGQCAGGFVPVRMQPTGGDAQRTSGNPGASCPSDARDNGADSHHQRAATHDGFDTAAGVHDANSHQVVTRLTPVPPVHGDFTWP